MGVSPPPSLPSSLPPTKSQLGMNSWTIWNVDYKVRPWNYGSRFVRCKATRDFEEMKRLDFWCDLMQLSNSQSHQTVSNYKRDIWSDCHALCLMKCYKDFDTSHYPLFTYSRQKPTGKLSEIIHSLTALSRLQYNQKFLKHTPLSAFGIMCCWIVALCSNNHVLLVHLFNFSMLHGKTSGGVIFNMGLEWWWFQKWITLGTACFVFLFFEWKACLL